MHCRVAAIQARQSKTFTLKNSGASRNHAVEHSISQRGVEHAEPIIAANIKQAHLLKLRGLRPARYPLACQPLY